VRDMKCWAGVRGLITRAGFNVDVLLLVRRFALARWVLQDIKQAQAKSPTPQVDERLKIIDDLMIVDEVTKELACAERGEMYALYRVTGVSGAGAPCKRSWKCNWTHHGA